MQVQETIDKFNSNPLDESSFLFLEKAFASERKWQELLKIYGQRLEALGNSPQAGPLWIRLGETYKNHILDDKKAVQCFRKALQFNKAQLSTIQNGWRLALKSSSFEDAIFFLEQEAALVEDPLNKSSVFSQIGKIYLDNLQNPAQATDFFKKAMLLDKQNLDAFRGLERILEAKKDYFNLIRLYRLNLENTTKEEDQKKLLKQIAQVYEQRMGDIDKALETHLEIYQKFPEDSSPLRVLETLARKYDKWEILARASEIRAEALGDDKEAEKFWRATALIWESKLGNREKASSFYQRVLKISPSHPEGLHQLKRLYRELERWEDLANLLKGQLEEFQGKERGNLLLEIAQVLERDPQQKERTLEFYLESLRISGKEMSVIHRAESLARELERPKDLLEIIEKKLPLLSEKEDQYCLLMEMGELLLVHLENPEKAAEEFKRAGLVFPNRLSTLERLKRAYHQNQNYTALVQAYSQTIKGISEAPQKAALLAEMAEVENLHLGQKEKALAHYSESLELQSGQGEVLVQMISLARDLGQLADLSEVLKNQMSYLDDPGKQVSLCVELARTFLKAGDLSASQTFLEKARTLILSDAEVLELLGEVLEAREDWQGCLEVLREKAQMGPPEGVGPLHLKIGQIAWKKLGKGDQASEVLFPLLENPLYQREASALLKEIYQQEEKWEELCLLLEKINPSLPREEYREKAFELAEIYQTHRKDPGKAGETYRKILQYFPQEPQALKGLEHLYRTSGEKENLAEILVHRGQEKGEVALLLEAVELYREGENLPEGLKILEEICHLDPSAQNLISLKALAQKQGDFSLVGETLERLYGIEPKREYLRELSALYLKGSPNPEKAIYYLDQLVEKGEGTRTNLEKLSALYLESQNWKGFCRIEELRLSLIEEEDDLITSLKKIAEIYQDKLHQPYQALPYFEKLAKITPEDPSLLLYLRSHYNNFGEYEKLVDLLQKLISLSERDEEKFEYLLEEGKIYEEKLLSGDKALESYQRAYQIEKTPEIFEKLKGIYFSRRKYLDLVNLLKEKLSEGENPDLSFEIAHLHYKNLHQKEEALFYYQKALKGDPPRRDALEALLQIYREKKDWEEMEKLLGEFPSLLSSSQRARWFFVLAQEPPEREGAKRESLLEKSLEIDGNFWPSWKALEDLYWKQEGWEKLLGLTEKKLSTLTSASLRSHLYLERGKIYEEKVGDLEKAEESYWNILTFDEPENFPALQALSLLYSRQEAPEKEMEILHRKLRILKDREQIPLLRRLSQLHWKLGRKEEARQNLIAALEIDPTNYTLLLEMEELYENLSHHQELYQIYKIQATLELSEFRARHLYGRLFSLAREETSLEEEACQWAEKLIQRDPQNREALEFLFQLYESRREVERLTQIVALQEKGTFKKEKDLLEINLKLARIWEDQDLGQAISFYKKVRQIDPSHPEALESLKQIHLLNEDYSALAQLYNEELFLFPNDSQRLIELHFELGKLYREKLSQPEKALEEFKGVLQIDPTHHPSKEPLEAVLLETERWRELSALYLSMIEYSPSWEEQSQYYCKLGNLLEEKLDKGEQARNCYRRAISLNPSHFEALEWLIKKSLKGMEWAQALEFLELKLKNLSEPEEVIDLKKKVAAIYIEGLQDSLSAAFHYEEVLDLTPDIESMKALEKIYRSREDWPNYLIIQEKLSPLLDEMERGELFLKMAQTWEKVQDQEKALHYYELAREILPLSEEMGSSLLSLYESFGHYQKQAELYGELIEFAEQSHLPQYHIDRGKVLYYKLGEILPAIEDLERALELEPTNLAVAELLRDLYEEAGLLNQRCELLKQIIELTEVPQRKLRGWMELGGLFKNKLYRTEEAIQAYQKALEMDENPEILLPLGELLEGARRWEALLDILEKQALLTEDSNRWIELKKRKALLYSERLQNSQEAIETYKAIRENHPKAIFPEEKSLLEQEKRWEDLVELLSEEIQKIPAPLVRSELLVTQGDILRNGCRDLEKARESYRKALENDSQCRKALESLREISEEQQDWEEYEEMALREAEITEDEDPVHSSYLYTRLGERELEKEQTERAIDYLKRALTLDKTSRNPVILLRELYEKNRLFDETLAMLDREAIIVEDPEDKAALYVRKGKILLGILNLPQEASEAFKRALEHKPYHKFALKTLGEIAFDQQNLPEVISYYVRYLDSADKNKYKAQCLLATYRVAYTHRQLGDIPSALLWYQKCLDLSYSYPAALIELGNLYVQNKQWKKAHPLYEEILRQREEKGIQEEQSLDLFLQMGTILTGLEQYAEAIYYYEKVIAVSEKHREALSKIAELNEKLGKGGEAIIYYQHAAKAAENPQSQSQFYEKIAEVYRLQEETRAYLTFLEKAHRADPTRISPLEKLVSSFYNYKLWKEIIRLVPPLLELEERVEKKAEYYYYLGTAYFEGQREFQQALTMLNFALELQPHYMAAIKAKVLLFSLGGNWEEMARCYEELLESFGGSESEKLAVHLKLADLYCEKLGQIPQAISYYERVLERDPHNPVAHNALAHLYIQTDRDFQKAFEENLYLLKTDFFHPKTYHNLAKIFVEIQNKTRLKQSLRILHLLRDLKGKEEALHQKYGDLQKELLIPQEIWSRFLKKTEEDGPVEKLFTLINPHMEKAYPWDLESLGIRKKEHLPRDSSSPSSLVPMKILHQFEEIFGPLDLHVYLLRRKKSLLLLENTTPPSLIISKGALEFFREDELVHILGTYFSHVLCQRYLIMKLSHQELERLFIYLAGMVYSDIRVGGIPQEDLQLAIKAVRSSLPRKIRREAEPLIEEYWNHREEFPLPGYYKSIVASAHRFGLVLTQDIEVSIRAIFKLTTLQDLPDPSSLDTQGVISILQTVPAIAELLQFAMSEDFSVLMAQER